MAKPPKKRTKKYRSSAPILVSPLTGAVVGVEFVPDEHRKAIVLPLYEAVDRFRFDLAVKDDWCLLADAANHAVSLLGMGICTDPVSRKIINDGYATLGKIAQRWRRWGRLQATNAEADILEEACERHEIQLLFTSTREMGLAIQALLREKEIRRAKRDALNLEMPGVPA